MQAHQRWNLLNKHRPTKEKASNQHNLQDSHKDLQSKWHTMVLYRILLLCIAVLLYTCPILFATRHWCLLNSTTLCQCRSLVMQVKPNSGTRKSICLMQSIIYVQSPYFVCLCVYNCPICHCIVFHCCIHVLCMNCPNVSRTLLYTLFLLTLPPTPKRIADHPTLLSLAIKLPWEQPIRKECLAAMQSCFLHSTHLLRGYPLFSTIQ